MRQFFLPLVCVAGCLAGGAAAAQTADIPPRLSLSDAVRLAEARNPALDAARQQVALAEADAAGARRRLNPVAGVLSEGYHGQSGGTSFFNQQELSLEVGQEFELAGKRRLRSQAADAATGRSRSTLDDQLRQLRLDVQRAYFQLVLARLDADMARASLTEIDKMIAVNRSRYQQGEVSGGELRRLEVERLKFSDDALQADLGIRNSRAALLALLGATRLDLPIEPTDTLEAPGRAGAEAAGGAQPTPGPAPDALALTGQALLARPDMAAARKDQERANAEVALQHALVTPNLTVTGGFKRDFGTNGLILGFAVPLPLADRNAPGIARAEADRRLAGSELRAREVAVSLDVQQAVNLVDVSRERVASIEHDYLQKAREARDAVAAAYRVGEGQLLDFLDAQRAYREVQRAYSRALFDYRLSVFELDAAVGATSRGSRP